MRARRFSTVARSLGASALVLLVLALAACESGETKSGGGGVPTGREPAGESTPPGLDRILRSPPRVRPA